MIEQLADEVERQNFMRLTPGLTFLAPFLAVCAIASFVAPASGGVAEWLSQVATGSPAGYSRTYITSPIVDNIGTYDETGGGGVTYEFLVNATNAGASSALMGTFQNPPPVGDRAGLKYEQWPDTLHYGTTVFGVADYDSGVNITPGVNTHLAFVNNATDTLLYVNGALRATIAGSSPVLGGQQGIGQIFVPAPGPHIDTLTGTIYGVAVYDAALGASEILAHSRAFFVPEPSSLILLLGAATCVLCLRSRRAA